MLFKREILDGIARGEITLALRRWKRPTVMSGGQLRTSAGTLRIGAVAQIALAGVTTTDARRAGYATLAEAIASLSDREGDVYRIELQGLATDARAALRKSPRIAADARQAIAKLVARLDSKRPGYVRSVLRAIQSSPGTSAADLAEGLGIDKPMLKRDIRQLKEHGLTESLTVGYRLSPRGEAWLAKERG